MYYGADLFLLFHISFRQYTPLDQLDKKHFAKGARTSEQSGGAPGQQKLNSMKEISLMEAKLQRMCELLKEVCWFVSYSVFLQFIVIQHGMV